MTQDDPFKYFRVEAAELMESLYAHVRGIQGVGVEASKKALQEMLRAAHSLKGAARLMELPEIGCLAHHLEDLFSNPKQTDVLTDPIVVRKIIGMLDRIQSRLEVVLGTRGASQSIQRAEVTPSKSENLISEPGVEKSFGQNNFAAIRSHSEIMRVDGAVMDGITRTAADIVELGEQSGNWVKLVKRSESAAKEIARTHGECTAVTELTQALRDLEAELGSGSDRLRPAGRNIHRMALDAKLVVVEEFVHRYEKIVRDTCRDLEKNVSFAVHGSNLRVDRHILQKLSEPLAHLLRNAVYHGIEDEVTRVQSGKPAQGNVELVIERVGEKVKIVLTDDGRGLDSEKLREAVVNAGYQVPQHADPGELIWGEGVSTSKGINLIAGRGVGLSVVKEAVRDLGGRIYADFEKGKWCRFTLEVPSSLDIIDVFVFFDGGERYLLPLTAVLELRVVQSEQIVEYDGRSCVMIDNQPVRIVTRDRYRSTQAERYDNRSNIVILREGPRTFGLLVDYVQCKQRVVIKALDPSLSRSVVTAGAAIMSDGRPAFLLSPTGLFKELFESSWLVSKRPDVRKLIERPPVLVVDDSLTTRMLEKAILESAGYETTLAKDGEEALRLLQDRSFKLIIVDFEMPSLDGVELTRALRAMELHAETPVIMLTSRGSDEDKRRGLQAGVQAYLVKGRFDQTEFLSTVKGLMGDLE